jgi:hypothetical protein
MSLRFPIVLVLSFVCLPTPAWADFETGMDAYERGNYATAMSEWRPLAENGDAQAQLHLGMLYHQAQGVPQDYATARQWYEKAAAQGDASGQNNLGYLYADGKGVPKDEKKEWSGYAKLPNSARCTAMDAACRRTMCKPICGSTWEQRTEQSVGPRCGMRSPDR